MSDLVNRLRELADAVTCGRDAVASEFTMSIPARPERDADLVLSAAADEIERLRATLERQQLSYEREREIDQDEIERLRNELRKSHEHQHEAEALAGHYLVQRDDARDALAAERERCAQVCDDEARLWEAAGNGPAAEARLCAARIRELA